MKSLIVLTGDSKLKNAVSDLMVDLGSAKAVSLYGDLVETLAETLAIPVAKFSGRGASKALPTPISVSAKHLSRFASKTSMGILPISLAGQLLKTPKDAMEFFFKTLGDKKWGVDWPVDRFWDNYAYFRDGNYVLADGDQHIAALKDRVRNKNLILVRLNVVVEGSASPAPEKGFLNVNCGEKANIAALTKGLLEQIEKRN